MLGLDRITFDARIMAGQACILLRNADANVE